MEKPPYAGKVVKTLALIALITVTSISLACAIDKQNYSMRPVPESLVIRNQGVTVSNGQYNISYSINAQESSTIEKILIKQANITDPTTNVAVNKVTIYINGTTMKTTSQLNYQLNSGSSLQLNIIIPCTATSSNQTSLTIYASKAMYYIDTVLP
ncbi:MAG: hypothetical protein ACFCUE_13025 [Candidatus Bathyarchaeia archaeon]|jgi:uncharacterized protein (TIGR02588 family)